jgi:predicted permease
MGHGSVVSIFHDIVEDSRYALRRFQKSPGYAILAVGTIAIGVGANTAIFSVLDAVLLRPLPFPEPQQLVQIWETNPQLVASRTLVNPNLSINRLHYEQYLNQNRTLSGLAYVQAWGDGSSTIAGGDRAPELVGVRSVSSSFFSVLDLNPALGRAFLPEDDDLGVGGSVLHSAIPTYDLWVRRHRADPDIIGKRVSHRSSPLTVVGILPEGFAFPPISEGGRVVVGGDVDVYVPATRPTDTDRGRSRRDYTVLARVTPGTSVEEVQTDLQRMFSNLAQADPETPEGWGVGVTPLQGPLARDFGGDLYLVMGIVGLVLLIACLNLAHLLFAMGSRRKAELAVRTAIGGSRRRQLQLLLTESLLLSGFGGVVGLVVARLGLATLLELVLLPASCSGPGLSSGQRAGDGGAGRSAVAGSDHGAAESGGATAGLGGTHMCC